MSASEAQTCREAARAHPPAGDGCVGEQVGDAMAAERQETPTALRTNKTVINHGLVAIINVPL